MNDVQIKYFLSVAQNLNFTKTAEEFFVSQPAVSRQIASLEMELNTVLFRRNNNKIHLTEAGSLYYDFFRQSIQKLEIINEKTNMSKTAAKRFLRIGWVECWDSSKFYSKLLNRVNKFFPNVTIQPECYGFKELEYLLKKGQLDVIITYDFGIEHSEGIKYREICQIPKAIFYSKVHPLGNRENVELGLFSNERFFVISEQDAINVNDLTISVFKPYGIVPKFENVKNIETMIALSQSGIGVALLNTWSSLVFRNDFRYIRLDNSHDKIIIAWRQDYEDNLISFIVEQMLDILN